VAPLRAGKTAAAERESIKPVDSAIVEDTLKWVNPVVASMIRLQQITGMRSANVCMMRPCEIDRSGEVWLYRPARHKTLYRGKELIIPLGPKAQAIIQSLLERNPEDFLFVPAEGVQRPTRRHRRHYSPASYRRSIWYACEANGIPAWHPHQLRHNVGTEVRKLFGLEGSQAILGHASLAATQIYSEKSIALAVSIAKQLG
jgi:integrase